ncbi:1-deoxy-D-xylulose-5-phosphate reductoisomerase [Flammeovirga yaeyamensis]|uniref:1-deoxy-D-xylulose 5-phosphate reductoisomerase n=1 Tax=Flammeovirga yaeyamensis TaxID=367791 RepID=A0AAX1N2Z4_9BACT|nr:1-deoxy-D-xylulose-5-phosphate reductoisomerase [Flammeovirga yaeyamensis]MBB3701527.1 1-deoxy-D-xylulose-5-phosphate reductoisomerase [Flammeovirga yaeyamensis]NMF38659.1 1-deoxy-D-xylulose-5-phosphate reductoisomerase [Flammeovirga yaeyamensis]QWG01846.1 1-deoxy-D-xylulose-5-phosphate reductoisomerase [Flammeovirga yaeyamensis]
MTAKSVAILGSTGSIGTQALDVVRANTSLFSISILSAGNNVDLLIKQCIEFKPRFAIIGNKDKFSSLKEGLKNEDIQLLAGVDGICEALVSVKSDIVLTALVGYAGLKPTLTAIDQGITIALANKETLVVAGELVTARAQEKNVAIIPVDSEHSAIFQCLVGEDHNPIEKVILTASGGPFRGKKREELLEVTKAQALKHPNWSMGAKITIDSASLMNKGLEVIEAKWLFDVDDHQIDVIVHPQSIIHSLVQFEDGSMKAQMGLPDMKLPIQYALGYPNRLPSDFERFNFMDYPTLTFETPDKDTFVNLQLAYNALKQKGNAACILNAANEIAVERFLKDEIKFLEIAELNSYCMENYQYIASPSYEDYVATDTQVRELAKNWTTK